MLKKILPLLIILTGCNGQPSRERFPGVQGRTTEIQQAQTQQAVLGGFDPTKGGAQVEGRDRAAPFEGRGNTAPAPSDPSASVKGVVRLGKNVKLKPGMFFFLAVRRPEGGPPLAVRREVDAKFPYKFSLSAADAMIPGTPFDGDVILTARVKSEGDPLSRKAGDASGSVSTKVGDQKIVITIDQVEN